MIRKVKRRFRPAGWLLAAGAGLATNAADASVAVNGCAALGQAVSRGVSEALASRFYGSSRRDIQKPEAGSAPQSCGTTAAVTSSAFATALSTYGIEVGWNDGVPGDPGDTCLSHYLDQCYPEARSGPLAFARDGSALVDRAWMAVRAGVRRSMPFGAQSDLAWFRPAELGESLAVAVEATLAVPEAPPSVSTWLEPYGSED